MGTYTSLENTQKENWLLLIFSLKLLLSSITHLQHQIPLQRRGQQHRCSQKDAGMLNHNNQPPLPIHTARPSAHISHEGLDRSSGSCALLPGRKQGKESAGQEGGSHLFGGQLDSGPDGEVAARCSGDAPATCSSAADSKRAPRSSEEFVFWVNSGIIYAHGGEGGREGARRRRSRRPLLLLCCYWSSHLITVQRSAHPPPLPLRCDTHVFSVRCVQRSLGGGGLRVT